MFDAVHGIAYETAFAFVPLAKPPKRNVPVLIIRYPLHEVELMVRMSEES